MPTTPDFAKIWSSNSSLNPYSWSDADYLKGWETVGNVPPSRGQFDALQKTNDEKAKWLKDTLDPIVQRNREKGRQPSTAYSVGDVIQSDRLPIDWFLVCTTAGTSDSGAISFPAVLLDGLTVTDGSAIWTLHHIATYGGQNYRKALTSYSVGDIVYSTKLPSYLRLECVSAGITGTTEPNYVVQAGQYVTDGTAVFLVTDIRDGSQVGDIKLSPVLRKGYVKANGALMTSARENYPRLITFLTENPSLKAADDTAWGLNKALYVYDSNANTLRVPDATGRVLQGGSDVKSVEAGLPNITGMFTHLYPTDWGRPSGACYTDGATTPSANGRTNGTSTQNLKIDASRSNAIYGASTTVQPPALTLIPQIKY